MKKSTQKLVDCINEIYKDSQEQQGKVYNLGVYAEAHGTSAGLSCDLQKQGMIKKGSPGVYEWVGGRPTEILAHKIEEDRRTMWRNRQNNKNANEPANNIVGPHIPENSFRFDDAYDKMLSGLEVADKYNIPQDMRKAFVKEMFLGK